MHGIPRIGVALVIAFVLVLSGCDTNSLSGESIFLSYEISEDADGEDIIFAFSTDDIQTGRLVDLRCDCTVDVGEFLQSQGFSKSELVSARLESAQIVMLFPTSEQVDFLDDAILKLSAPGISPTEVANQSSFPAARQVTMQVLANRDVASFLDSSGFEPILQIEAGELLDDDDYQLSVIFRVRMELEGV